MIAMVLPLLGPFAVTIQPVAAQSVVSAILTDPLTGIAIGGYDPVSYFTEAAPLQGRAEFEFDWMGVPWTFANAANLEVFRRHPDLYAPQFGGHGAISMSRGFVADADPALYTVYKERLFLFYSAANREAFLLSPDAAALRAEAHWQVLSKTLSQE